MKQQTKTYLLLALVLIIWGVIAFKVFGGLSSSDTDVRTLQNVKFKPKEVKAKDTFSILANYRDPFLGTRIKTKKKQQTRVKQPKQEAPQIEVLYTGHVTDSSTKKNIFFVTINGQQYLMNLNSTIQNITLISGSENQIRVRSNGKTRSIPIRQK